ncbi:ABC transporter ATP-binding protein [Spiroplasma taiwanense]|uniref:ABC transporter ATP-binding protein n=1 Tax=Spiroplasma taiwanense CT-1 TaxID=1276220 RepID=S5LYX8_9MOLU|nr:ABC transporter ATP-binding protein [Spiroplasma taiwanense]AGR40897.1 ABC transporter ATP-binding protein [Spiroplasma taiwanense CT-1]
MKRKKFQSDKAFSKKKFIDSLLTIFEGIKKFPITFLGLFFFIIFDSLLFSSTAVIVNKMISNIQNTGGQFFLDLKMTWESWAYFGLVLFIALIVFEYFTNLFSGLFSRKMEVYLRIRALRKLIEIDISYYSKTQIGLIMSRIMTDSQGVGDAFNEFLLNFIYTLVSLISTLIVLYLIDVKLASIILGLFIFMVFVVWFLFLHYRRAIIYSVDEKQAIDADITDRLINIRAIKAVGAENKEVFRNAELHKKYDEKLRKVIGWQSILSFFSNTFAWTMPTIVIISAVLIYNDINPAELSVLIISFSSACYNILYSILSLPMCMRGLTKLSNCVMRLNYINNAKSLIEFKKTGTEIEKIDTVEFKKLSFSYPESPSKLILPEINFIFEKGKSYAFVGETGVGKSTIAKLILRFYDPTHGSVLINGIDLKTLKMSNYLGHVGYIEQEPQILFGTVMQNIKYASFQKTDQSAIEASKKAKLHDYIMSLPDKYDTILGERGFMLSGGQKQRLVIARFFLKNPELLILDEATSALDNVIEKEIQAELDELMIGRTTIIIAHRLSTIKNVNQIIVLDKKGIVQTGSFQELKEISGRFQKLYKIGLMK